MIEKTSLFSYLLLLLFFFFNEMYYRFTISLKYIITFLYSSAVFVPRVKSLKAIEELFLTILTWSCIRITYTCVLVAAIQSYQAICHFTSANDSQ